MAFDDPSLVLLTAAEASKVTGLSESALRDRRIHGRGPAFVKMSSHHVRYRLSDLNAFLDACTVRPVVGAEADA